MRNLNNKDLFKVMRIVRKANIKEELVNMRFDGVTDEEYGTMIVFHIIESAPQAEKEIFEFLADVGGVKVEELENDEFELLPRIIEHLQGQKKLIDFLSQAFKSVTS
ncbi:hypothetical protein ACLIBH_07570 [Virgibacillus sp. W0430]|uniref:hypothetical protein n=1 Tax=Virgibacillus sp. W0430 TaxID=3391580 RepID=UPI003F4577B6